MATMTDAQAAEARAQAVRADPRVVVHRRTTNAPLEPAIQGTPDVDILELLGRREAPAEGAEPAE
jgi:hypothetical protein